MNRDLLPIKPCPDGHPDHGLVPADDATAHGLNVPRGSLLHLDRRRTPKNGSTVLAEVVVQQRRVRTVRRFTLTENVVSLARIAAPGAPQPTLIRPRHEVGILGVVDGHIVPLDRP